MLLAVAIDQATRVKVVISEKSLLHDDFTERPVAKTRLDNPMRLVHVFLEPAPFDPVRS